MKMNSAAEPQGEAQKPGKPNLRLVKNNQSENTAVQPQNHDDPSISEVIDRIQDSIPAPDESHEIDVDLSDLEAPVQTQRPAARLKPAQEVKKDLFEAQAQKSSSLPSVDHANHTAEPDSENYFKLSTFSEVAARVQNPIPTPVERPKARPKPDDLDTDFEALDKNSAYQGKLADEVNDYVQEENRKVAEYQEARKSRGFFRKIADAASDIWNGTTHEERAAGKKGVAGFRGLFTGKEQRTDALMKKAGVTQQELATANSAPAQAVQKPLAAGKKSGWFRNLFKSQKETMKEIFEAGEVNNVSDGLAETAQTPAKSASIPVTDLLRTSGGVQNRLLKKAGIDPTELAKMVDPDVVQKPSGFLRNLFRSSKAINDEMYESTGVDAEAEINLNPVTADHTVQQKGFFRKIFGKKHVAVKVGAIVVAAAAATGTIIVDKGGCGSGGSVDGAPINVTTSSGEGGGRQEQKSDGSLGSADAGQGGANGVSESAQGGASSSHGGSSPNVAQTEPVTPVPDVPSKDTSTVPNTPQSAKTGTLPKPPVVISPKTQETPKIPATQKTDRLCKEDSVPGVNVVDCLVPENTANFYRAQLITQLDSQQKAFDRIFEPIEKGPVFLGFVPFERTNQRIVFGQDQVASHGQPENLLLKQNDQRHKIMADRIAEIRKKTSDAKTLKQFYDVSLGAAQIGKGLEQLEIERKKQIAANYVAANLFDKNMIEVKTRDLKDRSGHEIIFSNVDGNKDGVAVTGSKISVTIPASLRGTSEAEMFGPPPAGNNPDLIQKYVQSKIEQNTGLVQVADSIDSQRVQLPTETEKTVDAPHSEKKVGQVTPPRRSSRRIIPRGHTVMSGTASWSF